MEYSRTLNGVRTDDYFGGIDNEALDFGPLEFMNAAAAVAASTTCPVTPPPVQSLASDLSVDDGSKICNDNDHQQLTTVAQSKIPSAVHSLTLRAETTTCHSSAALALLLRPQDGNIVSRQHYHHNAVNIAARPHHLPESPPDSGSEPSYSPAGDLHQQQTNSIGIPITVQAVPRQKDQLDQQHCQQVYSTLSPPPPPPIPLPLPPPPAPSPPPPSATGCNQLNKNDIYMRTPGTNFEHHIFYDNQVLNETTNMLSPLNTLQPSAEHNHLNDSVQEASDRYMRPINSKPPPTIGLAIPDHPMSQQRIKVGCDNNPPAGKKRKISQTDQHPMVVKTEPVSVYASPNSPCESSVSGVRVTLIDGITIDMQPQNSVHDTSLASDPGGSSLGQQQSDDSSGSLQCIRFSPFQQQNWHILCDQNLQQMPVPLYRVDADKGFNFSNSDEAFVCQKKNHFQITCHAQLQGAAVFVRTSVGLEKIKSFYLHFYGVKLEAPSHMIRVEQSQSDRSKKPFHPVPLELHNLLVSKVTVGRLHFSETTSNNMRKKGRPNPDQRYFQLVVGLHAHTLSGHFPVVSHGSDRIIVRASNPGQFESDVELCWQRGLTPDSIFHAGRVGINTDRPDESFVVHGNLKISGHIIQPSDSRAKKEISELDTSEQLRNLERIRIVKFRYVPEFALHSGLNTAHNGLANDNGALDIIDTGVIAQELREVLPDAVQEGGSITLPNGEVIENFLLVNKDRIFMENIGAVKELSKVTGSLETRIEQLEKINSRLIQIQNLENSKTLKKCKNYFHHSDPQFAGLATVPLEAAATTTNHSYLHHCTLRDFKKNLDNGPEYCMNDGGFRRQNSPNYSRRSCSGNNRGEFPKDINELCSNRTIQLIIIILVLLMAVCLAAISALYFVEHSKQGDRYFTRYGSNSDLSEPIVFKSQNHPTNTNQERSRYFAQQENGNYPPQHDRRIGQGNDQPEGSKKNKITTKTAPTEFSVLTTEASSLSSTTTLAIADLNSNNIYNNNSMEQQQRQIIQIPVEEVVSDPHGKSNRLQQENEKDDDDHDDSDIDMRKLQIERTNKNQEKILEENIFQYNTINTSEEPPAQSPRKSTIIKKKQQWLLSGTTATVGVTSATSADSIKLDDGKLPDASFTALAPQNLHGGQGTAVDTSFAGESETINEQPQVSEQQPQQISESIQPPQEIIDNNSIDGNIAAAALQIVLQLSTIKKSINSDSGLSTAVSASLASPSPTDVVLFVPHSDAAPSARFDVAVEEVSAKLERQHHHEEYESMAYNTTSKNKNGPSRSINNNVFTINNTTTMRTTIANHQREQPPIKVEKLDNSIQLNEGQNIPNEQLQEQHPKYQQKSQLVKENAIGSKDGSHVVQVAHIEDEQQKQQLKRADNKNITNNAIFVEDEPIGTSTGTGTDTDTVEVDGDSDVAGKQEHENISQQKPKSKTESVLGNFLNQQQNDSVMTVMTENAEHKSNSGNSAVDEVEDKLKICCIDDTNNLSIQDDESDDDEPSSAGFLFEDKKKQEDQSKHIQEQKYDEQSPLISEIIATATESSPTGNLPDLDRNNNTYRVFEQQEDRQQPEQIEQQQHPVRQQVNLTFVDRNLNSWQNLQNDDATVFSANSVQPHAIIDTLSALNEQDDVEFTNNMASQSKDELKLIEQNDERFTKNQNSLAEKMVHDHQQQPQPSMIMPS